MTKKSTTSIHLSVGEFALPIPRTGHIETHSGYGHLPPVGVTLHQILQHNRKSQDPAFQSEVPLQHIFFHQGFRIIVSGRMDGLTKGEPAHIEEFKTSYDAPGLIHRLQTSPEHPYILQLLTYGYFFYLRENKIPRTTLTVVATQTLDETPIEVSLSVDAYKKWLHLRLAEIILERKQIHQFRIRGKTLAPEVEFPFKPMRTGQDALVAAVEDLPVGGKLLVQAPTGLGKTIGISFPLLRSALASQTRIIYLTPKNSQHQIAEEAIDAIRSQDKNRGDKIKSITINAKHKMCLKEEPICNPEYCEFARDYYKKIAENSVAEKIKKFKGHTSSEKILKLANRFEVCPFELQLEALEFHNVVICDYNYAFAPRNSLGRLNRYSYAESSTDSDARFASILVVDEAHNLVSRALDYFSAELNENEIQSWFEKILNSQPLTPWNRVSIENLRQQILQLFVRYAPQPAHHPQEQTIPLEDLKLIEQKMLALWSELMLTAKSSAVAYEIKRGDGFLSLINTWSQFCSALEVKSEGTLIYSEYSRHDKGVTSLSAGRGNGTGMDSGMNSGVSAAAGLRLRICSLDASMWLSEAWPKFAKTVLFSATLKPFDYYLKTLGFTPFKETKTLEIASPFGKHQRKIILVPQVSTKYSERSRSLSKIWELVARTVKLQSGNYALFFPSFQYLEQAMSFLNSQDQSEMMVDLRRAKFHIQSRKMSKDQINEYLRELARPTVSTSEPAALQLLVAVQGGVFSEGVDYPGKMLIGAFIIGPPLPFFGFENEKMREFYQTKLQAGMTYTYIFPAMAKSIQAAGRVIRRLDDRGVLFLLDDRFLLPDYAAAMPKDWFNESPRELLSSQILKDLEDFWRAPSPEIIATP